MPQQRCAASLGTNQTKNAKQKNPTKFSKVGLPVIKQIFTVSTIQQFI